MNVDMLASTPYLQMTKNNERNGIEILVNALVTKKTDDFEHFYALSTFVSI